MVTFLLDQNIPYLVKDLLSRVLAGSNILHAYDLGLARADDQSLFEKAQALSAMIITFDEDFADQRKYPVGTHRGVIRLRVEPTTTEATIAALNRLFLHFAPHEIQGKLVIIDERRFRIIEYR